jgi:hypothetical protein
LVIAACTPVILEGDQDSVEIQNQSKLGISLVEVEVGYFSDRARRVALAKADAYCDRFGKYARLVTQTRDRLRYECRARKQ